MTRYAPSGILAAAVLVSSPGAWAQDPFERRKVDRVARVWLAGAAEFVAGIAGIDPIFER